MQCACDGSMSVRVKMRRSIPCKSRHSLYYLSWRIGTFSKLARRSCNLETDYHGRLKRRCSRLYIRGTRRRHLSDHWKLMQEIVLNLRASLIRITNPWVIWWLNAISRIDSMDYYLLILTNSLQSIVTNRIWRISLKNDQPYSIKLEFTFYKSLSLLLNYSDASNTRYLEGDIFLNLLFLFPLYSIWI